MKLLAFKDMERVAMWSLIQFSILTMFLIGGALFTGYMFDSSFLLLNVLLYAGFSMLLIVQRKISVNGLQICILLYVACYWIACLYAVDVEAAILEASRVSSLIPLSFIAMMLKRDKLEKIVSSWPWIGLFLVVIGIALQLERDGRLESTMQYANSLAIILLVSILISLLSFARTKARSNLFLMAVNAVGLLLTFSRSVWVLWLISVVMMLVFIKPLRNKLSILTVAAYHLGSLVIAMLIKQDALFFLNRVSSIQTQTSEFQIRLVYWKDSVKMLQDYLLGGSGGGGWAVLQHIYQSKAYFVKFIHNHYVQVLLDVGLIGGIVWLTVIGIFYKDAISQLKRGDDERQYSVQGILIVATVMLLHAGFDFDLNFPLVFGMLLYLMLLLAPQGTSYDWTRLNRAAAVSAALIGTIFFIWLSTGYLWKEQGMRAVRNNDWVYAQEKFAHADNVIPWSASILYESAKVDVLKGNDSGDERYYSSATAKLKKASQRVPQQKLYSELIEAINKH